VIIATLGTIYSLGGDVDEEDPGLQAAIRSARWPDGRPVYTLPVAFSIMVFFALCAQCAATLMVIRRETNSWRWPIFAFVYMTALAYLGALLTYQIGTWLAG
ncbi:MAG: ferrous iron transport protein B, partial [Planctomycetota bacterium]